MISSSPITPPDELLEHWDIVSKLGNRQNALTLAYRAGADQELEASVAWLDKYGIGWTGLEKFRNARRPQPPTLKEQALGILDAAHHDVLEDDQIATIRRALEALPND
jgi:predicted NAD/FAD-dependent oxidoreductase